MVSHPVEVQALRGRITLVRLAGAVRQGLWLASVYLKVGATNAERLDELAELTEILRGLQGAVVLAGDWNCEPQELQWYNFMQSNRLELCRTGRPTCRAREIDYFLTRGLNTRRAICTLREGITAPHYSVSLTLQGRCRNDNLIVRVKPVQFPTEAMIGPTQPLPSPAWTTELGDHSDAWAEWVQSAVRHLHHLHGKEETQPSLKRGLDMKRQAINMVEHHKRSFEQKLATVTRAGLRYAQLLERVHSRAAWSWEQVPKLATAIPPWTLVFLGKGNIPPGSL
eukprot:4878426-Amphidinium_carterae.1